MSRPRRLSSQILPTVSENYLSLWRLDSNLPQGRLVSQVTLGRLNF